MDAVLFVAVPQPGKYLVQLTLASWLYRLQEPSKPATPTYHGWQPGKKEKCFSGAHRNGELIIKFSFFFLSPRLSPVPDPWDHYHPS